MEKKNKKYFKLVLLISTFIINGIATFNYVVNPIGIYGDYGVDDVYPAAGEYMRIHKTERIKHVKPDALIIGTSRANVGLNPKQELFPGMTPYNAALSASTIYEEKLLLKFAHKNRPLKKLVFTLDFYTFNTLGMENKHFEFDLVSANALDPVQSFSNTYGTLVSLDTILVAMKHFRYKDQIERRSYPKYNGHMSHNEGAWRAKKFGARSMFEKPPNKRAIHTKKYSFSYSDKSEDDTFKHLQDIIDFIQRENIDVIFVISPVHEMQLKIIHKQGRQQLFEEWKRRVTDIISTTPYPLWDFATYNPISTEPVPPAEDRKTQMKWWWDTNHYKEVTGHIMLQKILGFKDETYYYGFGKKLHSGTKYNNY